jgi:hypothetical protein
MLSDDEIKATILFKLHKRGNWGGSYTAFDNVKKGFKDVELGKHRAKRVDKLAKELIHEGLLSQNLHITAYKYRLIQGKVIL